MKIIDRYLLRAMGGPFVFGVLAFVLLFVSANILFRLVELVSQLGLSLWTATELFVLWLPSFVVLTFPLATLVAILIAFGRLSGDSELIAMHAGGIGFRRLVLPIALAGVVISLATAALNEFIVPAANRRSEDIVQAAMARAGKIVKDEVLYTESAGGEISSIIYADRLDVNSGELLNPLIVWFEQGRPTVVTRAARAVWKEDQWEMYDGETIPFGTGRELRNTFGRWTARIPTTPRELAEHGRSPDEMTYRELRERVRDALGQDEPTVELELKLHHKLSIPFACFVFALIAPPLGVRSHRGSSSIGMGIAILIGFGYYVVWHYLSAVAQQGYLSPFWAAWLPNVVTAAIGLILILNVRK
jgi:lipopolysaccharide export system permease protein